MASGYFASTAERLSTVNLEGKGELRWPNWKHRIRVLVLKPAVRYEAPLFGELVEGSENFAFDKKVPFPHILGLYTALSYAWGDGVLECPMTVDGMEIFITKNLDSALRHLRRNHESRRLWVDAICIDQTSTDDKNHFIPIMDKIFRSARRTVVWLGEASCDSHIAIHVLERAAAGDLGPAKGMTPVRDSSIASTPWWCNMSRGERVKWQALLNLSKRAWWQRIWVMQEVASSQGSIELVCGCPSTSFTQVRKGVSALFRYMLEGNQDWEAPKNLTRVLGMSRLTSFLKALIAGLQALATDPRDKVYGVLHLPMDEHKPNLAVDYGSSVAEVYTATARCIIHQEGNLDLLVLCDSSAAHPEKALEQIVSQIPNLPSWVPNWSDDCFHPVMSVELISAVVRKGMKPYRATHGLTYHFIEEDILIGQAGINLDNAISNASHELVLRVLLLSKISRLYLPFGTSKNGIDDATTASKTPKVEPDVYLDYFMSNAALMDLESETSHELKGACDEMLRCITCNRDIEGSAWAEPLTFSADINSEEVGKSAMAHMRGRRMFRLEDKNLGVGPNLAQEGDTVALVLGCSVPLVLRQVPSHELHSLQSDTRPRFRLIGVAYVDGVMDGELVEQIQNNSRDPRWQIQELVLR